MHGTPHPEDAEYRRHGHAGRAPFECLCAVADLRAVADVVLYRPLRVGEPTQGNHLEKIGMRNVLVGKTHMTPDLEGLKMLGNEEAERQSQKQKKPGGHQATGRYAIS